MVNIVTTRAAGATSAGNQDITTTDFGGGTPDCAIVIMTYADTDGTSEVDAGMSIGFSDGTTNYCCSFNAEDAQGSTDTRRLTDSSVINMEAPGINTDSGIATASMITNGVRLNWSDPTDSGALVTVILIGGVVNAKVNGVQLDVQDTNIAVTAGFQPTDVFCVFASEPADGAGANDARWSYGVYSSDENAQHCVAARYRTSTATAAPRATTISEYIGGVEGTGASDLKLELNSLSAQGFTITPRNDGGGNDVACLLSLELSAGDASVLKQYQLPSTTGTAAVTGLGITPASVMMFGGENDTLDTEQGDRGAFSIVSFDADNQYSNAVSDEDEADPTNCTSWADDSISLLGHTGTRDYSASFVSIDSGGFTLDWKDVGSGNYVIYWAAGATGIEETVTLVDGTVTITPYAVDVYQELAVPLSDGAVNLDGYVPTVLRDLDITVAPLYQSLTLDGFTPQLSSELAKTAELIYSDLTIDGYAPNIGAEREAQFITQALALDGFTPTLSVELARTAVAVYSDLTIDGYAPTVYIPIRTAVAVTTDLSIDGFVPTVAGDVVRRIDPVTGAVTIEGFAVGVGADTSVQFSDGELNLTGYVVTLDIEDTSGDCPKIWSRLGDSYKV